MQVAEVEGVVQHVVPLSPLLYVPIAKAEKSDLTMNSLPR